MDGGCATWLLYTRPFRTISPATHQGFHQVQPLTPLTSPAWSPWDPPPSLADGQCYLKVAQQSMADSGGPGCCRQPGAPLEAVAEVFPLREETRLVSDWRASSPGLPVSLGMWIPLQVAPTLSLVEVKPTFLPSRGRRNPPPPCSLGSCGREMSGAGQGIGLDPTQQGAGVAGDPKPPCPSYTAARTLTM